MHPSVDNEKLRRDGYTVIKGVFSQEEIACLRNAITAQFKEDQACKLTFLDGGCNYARGDLLSKKRLWRVLLDERILAIARTILAERPVYFGDSSYQIGVEWGKTGHKGGHWHKDNRRCDRSDPNGLDWQEYYPLIRFGIYLQDHARHSGALAVKVGSHLKAGVQEGTPVFVDTEIGDVAVWNLRTTHAGESVRFRFWPYKKFSAKWEWRMPIWLCVPQDEPRMAMFFTFGINDDHTHRYINECRSREDWMKACRCSQFGAEVWKAVENKDIEIVRVIPEYGTSGAAGV